jgi:hypothetical protein
MSMPFFYGETIESNGKCLQETLIIEQKIKHLFPKAETITKDNI